MNNLVKESKFVERYMVNASQNLMWQYTFSVGGNTLVIGDASGKVRLRMQRKWKENHPSNVKEETTDAYESVCVCACAYEKVHMLRPNES